MSWRGPMTVATLASGTAAESTEGSRLEDVYRLLRPLIFRLDPERAHELTLHGLHFASGHPGLLRMLSWFCRLEDERLRTDIFGLQFANPLLLAAGMDKNAVAVPAWTALGFGGAEVGTLTCQPQPGNKKPRLFRLPSDQAVINRMGFNNDGVEVAAERIATVRAEHGGSAAGLTLGINVGKSLAAGLDEAAEDYRRSLELVWPHADYVVLNVSSPNTPGLRQLQNHDRLGELLQLQRELQTRGPRPVLLKIAPDLDEAQLTDICRLAEEYGLSGLIATNTTLVRHGLKSDPDEAGGLSGLPLRRRSLDIVRFLRANTDLPLVAAGGIMTPADAVARLRAGASLLQLYTGYIYGGPGLVKATLKAILAELEREGLSNVSELTGLDA